LKAVEGFGVEKVDGTQDETSPSRPSLVIPQDNAIVLLNKFRYRLKVGDVFNSNGLSFGEFLNVLEWFRFENS
jgi:hypothetical protein